MSAKTVDGSHNAGPLLMCHMELYELIPKLNPLMIRCTACKDQAGCVARD
jgi:hypothetical protein